jgi:hypothetical protein
VKFANMAAGIWAAPAAGGVQCTSSNPAHEPPTRALGIMNVPELAIWPPLGMLACAPQRHALQYPLITVLNAL